MILQVDEETHELIIGCLLECGYCDVVEDIVVYQECFEKIDDENVVVKAEEPKSKKKKNKKLCVD
tara:strand:- start:385 stop:579 length:195 start_codon:yes stop_codon:yes gene_type:complete